MKIGKDTYNRSPLQFIVSFQREEAMPISQTILPEFENEMANTRKTLERVPDDKFAWKPHEKSSSLGGLATHLANIPSWTKNTFEQDQLDVATPGQAPNSLEEKKSKAQLIDTFGEYVVSEIASLDD